MATEETVGLNDRDVKKVRDFIARNTEIFVGPDGKLGRTTLVMHRIDTG